MPVTLDEQDVILTKATALLRWAYARGWRADRTTRLAFKLLTRMTEEHPRSAEALGRELDLLVAEEELVTGDGEG